jgi:hypothetical protein
MFMAKEHMDHLGISASRKVIFRSFNDNLLNNGSDISSDLYGDEYYITCTILPEKFIATKELMDVSYTVYAVDGVVIRFIYVVENVMPR